jgi:heptosyltransferase-2
MLVDPHPEPARPGPPAARVVVFAPNWLGDAVMALPALAGIRAHVARDASVLAVAARAGLAPLFTALPQVDEVVVLGAHGGVRALAGIGREVREVAAGRFDLAILLPNSFRSAWIARRAGVPERWGYAADLRGRLLTRAVRRPSGRCHQAEYYRQLVERLGIVPGPLEVHVAVPPEARARADLLLAEHGLDSDTAIVAMAPGAAYGRAKRWPPRRFAELAVRLAGELAAASVLVGAGKDRDAGRDIERELPRAVRRTGGGRATVVNLIGKTDLPLLLAVLARCRAAVSNDSGAMHLAAAVGVPVTAIFGASDERGTAPLPGGPGTRPPEIVTNPVWCRPCMLRECPLDHRCMTGISAERVMQAIRRIW